MKWIFKSNNSYFPWELSGTILLSQWKQVPETHVQILHTIYISLNKLIMYEWQRSLLHWKILCLEIQEGMFLYSDSPFLHHPDFCTQSFNKAAHMHKRNFTFLYLWSKFSKNVWVWVRKQFQFSFLTSHLRLSYPCHREWLWWYSDSHKNYVTFLNNSRQRNKNACLLKQN